MPADPPSFPFQSLFPSPDLSRLSPSFLFPTTAVHLILCVTPLEHSVARSSLSLLPVTHFRSQLAGRRRVARKRKRAPFATNRRKLETASSSFDEATPIATAATRYRVGACHFNNDETQYPSHSLLLCAAHRQRLGQTNQYLAPCLLLDPTSTLSLSSTPSCGLP